MINISNTLKNACNSDKITYREYVVLDGTTAPIEVMTEMYATAYKDTHFIGTFNMKYIKFTTSNDVQYRNKELTLYKEINGESFKVGNFIVTEIKDNDSNEEVTVTAYDYGLKFANAYISDLNYASGNVTLFQVLQECCNKCGVTLKNENITNGDFIVDSNQFTDGQLYGDVISAIAFISGNFATINNNNELELLFNTSTNEIIEDYVDLEDKRDTQPITSVSIGLSNIKGENVVLKDQNLIDEYGEHWLIINDVPFAYNQSKREQLITAIFNKVKGFGYSAFKSEYAFKPYLSLGDLIQFRNKEGQLINSIVLRITSKYDNIILEAPSVTSATVEYQNPLDALEVAKRTEIIVDKQNQEIQALASKVVDLSTTETGKGQVKFENATLGALGKISITGNVELFYPAVDEYGGMSVKSGIYKSGMVKASSYKTKSQSKYPSDDLFPRDTYLVIKQEDKEVSRYHLPIKRLNSTGSVSDEFIWEYNKMKIIHRVGIATNGDYYVLAQPYEEDLGELEITITEGDGYFVFESFPFATISITYMLKNEYTETFSTKVETKGEIKVASDEINLDVSKKLEGVSDEDGNVTSASIILAVNKDGSEEKFIADKISLEGYTTINEGFSVDLEGNMTANNGNFNGGKIELIGKNSNSSRPQFKITNSDNSNDNCQLYPDNVYFNSEIYGSSMFRPDYFQMANDGKAINMYCNPSILQNIMMFGSNVINMVSDNDGSFIQVKDADSTTSISPNGVWADGYYPNSRESKKKNIDKQDSLLEKIYNSDICSYNWKYEDDTDKKHIGLIIPDLGGNYNIPDEVLSHDKDAIDLYSMSGMSWKAIQELYDIIKLQEQKIKELEERLDGIK